MGKQANHPVKASRKTIQVLNQLRKSGGGRITEIAAAVDMNKSTVHNHLSTLEEEEFVVRDGHRYELSLRLLEFGGYLQAHHRLYRVARTELERLATRTGELVSITVEEYGRGVYLDCKRGDRAVNIDIYPGLRRPLHATGFGKAILAYLPATRVDEIIARHGLTTETPATITGRERLDEQLNEIRDRGFAVDDEELISGLQCVGTPILSANETVLGAVSVSQPISRADQQLLDEIPDQVRSTANVIELNLNHSQ
jgi:DNA-binding IclR family transcriptional regulator